MITLHQMHASGNCYKVRLAAHQLGIPLRLQEYPVLDGLTRKPEFLGKNPNGRVPLLEFEDGRTLAESGAILFHLTEGTKLQPDDAWSRAQMLQWMFFEQYSHEPYIAVARYWFVFPPREELERRRHLIAEWQAKGNAALAVMETHLARHDWFGGSTYSIADIALYGYTHCADEGGFDLSHYRHIVHWLARVRSEADHITMSHS
ncbi:MAG: glutathione S-transferase family protein [Alphaproteobacteria bacterium]|nr:glutathione S-transferase family protein [Alphaproteobacteria bacterium]